MPQSIFHWIEIFEDSLMVETNIFNYERVDSDIDSKAFETVSSGFFSKIS
jgi:hypothetical protein